MKSILKTILLLTAFAFLGGCAHSIRLTPDAEKLPTAEGVKRAGKNVGYYISDEERNRQQNN